MQVGRHTAADADAGNDQRGQADEDEEFAHPADETVGPGRGIVAGAIFEPCLRETLLQRLRQGFGIAADIVERHAVPRPVKRAGFEQACFSRKGAVDDDRGAEREALGQLVGLGLDNSRHAQFLPGDGHRVAHRGVEPVGSPFRDIGLARSRCVGRAPACQGESADQRIFAVDRLQPDRRGVLARRCHSLHPEAAGYGAQLLQRSQFVRGEVALPDR